MMERKHLHGITLLGGLAMVLLCGCIRDELEPCPPLRLSLEVADKNYVNSAAAARLGYEEERPEDLPFREYVSDLAYRVSDLETGRVVAERTLSPVEGDAGSVEVPLPADLPYGSYVLTAWGNLGDTAAFDSDLASLGLHPGGAEGSDAYFTRDTLVYALDSERFSCGMRRLKGKLILATERMPEAYAFSEWKVSDIMSRFSAEDRPSEGGNWIAPESVCVTMSRNELTILRYEYDPCCCRFKIFILINDNWETLHIMDVE